MNLLERFEREEVSEREMLGMVMVVWLDVEVPKCNISPGFHCNFNGRFFVCRVTDVNHCMNRNK